MSTQNPQSTTENERMKNLQIEHECIHRHAPTICAFSTPDMTNIPQSYPKNDYDYEPLAP